MQSWVVEFQLMGKRTYKFSLCCPSDRLRRSEAGQHIWAQIKDNGQRYTRQGGEDGGQNVSQV